jgi:DUF917 family protein
MVDSIGMDDLVPLATGAAILGTGGGGNPMVGRLRLQSILADGDYPDRVEVIGPLELDANAVVTSVGGMGAPTIGVEKLPGGDEELRSLRAIEAASDSRVDALIPGEIGGVNSIVPFLVGALADLPVIDADGMGRAFPELQMDTFFIYGTPVNYAALTDERGNQVLYTDIDSPERLETLARNATIEFGGRAGFAFPVMDGETVKDTAILHTVSLALETGRAVHDARADGADPVRTVCSVTGGRPLFEGKIIDVYRRNREGFAMGVVSLESLDGDATLEIEFQNEFLIARKNDETVAIVPDLICMIDNTSGEPITTEELRYGRRVSVLGIPAPEKLTTDRALDVIGPEAFGYDEAFVPLAGS